MKVANINLIWASENESSKRLFDGSVLTFIAFNLFFRLKRQLFILVGCVWDLSDDVKGNVKEERDMANCETYKAGRGTHKYDPGTCFFPFFFIIWHPTGFLPVRY
jgi:hypothetical protein